jgi:hypothetical protein
MMRQQEKPPEYGLWLRAPSLTRRNERGLGKFATYSGNAITIMLQKSVLTLSLGTRMTMAARQMRRPRTLDEDSPKKKMAEIKERIMAGLMNITGRKNSRYF